MHHPLPLTALATLPLLAALCPGDEDEPREPWTVGSPVEPEAIALRTLDGERVTLADFLPAEEEGEEDAADEQEAPIVVLDFWSISCPVSIAYEDRFVALHGAFAAGEEADVVLIAIDSNRTEVDADAVDPYGRIRKYVEKKKIPFHVLVDEGNAVADLFDAKTTPHVYVLDRQQVVRYVGALDDDPKGKKGEERVTYVEDAIAALRSGEEVPVKRTKERGCSIKRVPEKKGPE